MGGDPVDSGQDRLHVADAERVVKKAERDSGKPGLTGDKAGRFKALERENRELRQANEILRKASAYFAQAELGRRHKP